MEIKTITPWLAGGSAKEEKEVVGLRVEWDILCSSIGSPYKTCVSWVRFGRGIDKVQEVMEIASDIGLISVSGSWYYFDFLQEEGGERMKFHGQEKAYNYLNENVEAYEILEKKVREMLF